MHHGVAAARAGTRPAQSHINEQAAALAGSELSVGGDVGNGRWDFIHRFV